MILPNIWRKKHVPNHQSVMAFELVSGRNLNAISYHAFWMWVKLMTHTHTHRQTALLSTIRICGPTSLTTAFNYEGIPAAGKVLPNFRTSQDSSEKVISFSLHMLFFKGVLDTPKIIPLVMHIDTQNIRFDLILDWI